jgi:hypothetical protein
MTAAMSGRMSVVPTPSDSILLLCPHATTAIWGIPPSTRDRGARRAEGSNAAEVAFATEFVSNGCSMDRFAFWFIFFFYDNIKLEMS